jgi:hypothetical protein
MGSFKERKYEHCTHMAELQNILYVTREAGTNLKSMTEITQKGKYRT